MPLKFVKLVGMDISREKVSHFVFNDGQIFYETVPKMMPFLPGPF